MSELHVQRLRGYLLVHAQNTDGLQVWPHYTTAVGLCQEAACSAGPAKMGRHCATSYTISR
jgi:hypothetical protein